MNTLLDCRFMQTALGHAPCTLTDEELRSDFKDFQTALLDLLDGSGGYRTIDFMLQDTLCILEHISSKKNNTLLRLFVLRARSNLRTCIAQNNKRLTNPELFTSVSPVCRSPLHWGCKPIDLAEFLVYASEFGHSAMLRSPKSCVSTNGYTISNWVRRAI